MDTNIDYHGVAEYSQKVTKTGGNKNAHGLVFYRQMTHVRYYK